MGAPIYYLASPFTHADPGVMRTRYEHACEAAARLFERSVLTYSPIAHTEAVNRIGGLAHDSFEFWRTFDLGMIDRLDGVIVLMLDGWQASVGVAAEVEYARRTGKPVLWMVPDISMWHVVGYELCEAQPDWTASTTPSLAQAGGDVVEQGAGVRG